MNANKIAIAAGILGLASSTLFGCTNVSDPSGVGADLAANQAKRDDFFIVGVDGAPEAIEAIGTPGSIYAATATQDPRGMAETAVEVGNLAIAEQQQVEIARALKDKSRILVMDEPTAALSDRETEHLFEVIRKLRADGIAIIYISHRMEEIYALADRISVLRDGQYIGSLTRAEISPQRLVQMMVGRSP
jgi:hypothetical protein